MTPLVAVAIVLSGAALVWLADVIVAAAAGSTRASGARRLLFCRLLGWHLGPVETATAETDRVTLVVTYIPCRRCGGLHPVDVRPRLAVEAEPVPVYEAR